MSLSSLKKSRDFALVCKSPSRAFAKSIVLRTYLRPDNEQNLGARVGFVVSKRLGNAVIRNRIKRRLRALCSDIMTKNADPKHDYVILANSYALDRDFLQMAKDLKFTLHTTNTFIKTVTPSILFSVGITDVENSSSKSED